LDRRFLLLATLIVGLIIGAPVGYALNRLETQTLQTQISQKDSQIQSLQTQLDIEIQLLQAQINELSENLTELQKSKNWHQTAFFNGTDGNTTDTFLINGESWRISWSAEADNPITALFFVFVYPKGETTIFIEYDGADFSLVNPQNGVEYIAGKGEYYIKVLAANLEDWQIRVESYY
jgi:hypothetical protein